ncbi:MAG: vanadium-dependent haloperoxidase [Ilumatobacter sp.]|uniref:vanadium-dependent haloperoxidase n=1 Tax=Ilumatobacter sp. TaxID=1967498 RepID=UPI00260EE98F|nr:vanadium-dependent haloperoxidase [Ilumatobacter sp.]MDJ0769525.1 vanadium-dependent haloperoxidase [Ilumatobacter sp.]
MVDLRRAVTAAVAASLIATATGCSGDEAPYAEAGCTPADRGGRSVARVWDETVLDLIRQVIPAPTVHARNLFHTSAAMWDAWAAYDTSSDGYFVTERHTADDPTASREVAISYAAYRILLWRYGTVSDLPSANEQLDAVMTSLCYRTDYTASDGDSPADLGNRIAETVIEHGRDDGALEDDRYVDHSYRPVNEPMVVADPGTVMVDANAWQPLSLGVQIAQNGLPIPGETQTFIGPHWGHVTPFALEPSPTGTAIDPGPPPLLGDPATDQAYRDAAVEVVRYSALLDPDSGAEIDIGPGARGDNPLGSNDGDGYSQNPATGEPYEPNVVLHADFGRAIAEYWADGPDSETPPGHWNLIANAIQDAPGFERRFGGTGPLIDPLEWDVKAYFALNGAVHDAAIAAWGLKSHYDFARPISMIRHLAGHGQSSEPDGPSYHPDGIPLESGLIEVVTEASSAPGERHEALAAHVGEIAVRSWRGAPADPETETSGVGWVLAVDWVPYQRPSFVSPAFAGYVSGHSTFSRAGAEVLTSLTGSPFFPGGMSAWTVPQGALLHEEGPTEDLTLQWATYYDAADEAGISRLYGGIHITADDVEGRRIGATVGRGAWELAQRYFDGDPLR